jgi:hypothetical protein
MRISAAYQVNASPWDPSLQRTTRGMSRAMISPVHNIIIG